MPYLHTNEIALYYEDHGEGPVLAHGAGGNHLVWWQQVPDFARDFLVVTLTIVASASRRIWPTAWAVWPSPSICTPC